MSAYATTAELRERLGGTIYDEIYPAADTTAAGDLDSAAAEIDGAIAARYRLPVAGERSLALLRDWNLTLAEERAFARPAGSAFTEKIKSRVEQVRRYLAMIRENTFLLPDAAENGGSDSGGGIALGQCDAPVFGRERMRGFK